MQVPHLLVSVVAYAQSSKKDTCFTVQAICSEFHRLFFFSSSPLVPLCLSLLAEEAKALGGESKVSSGDGVGQSGGGMTQAVMALDGVAAGRLVLAWCSLAHNRSTPLRKKWRSAAQEQGTAGALDGTDQEAWVDKGTAVGVGAPPLHRLRT